LPASGRALAGRAKLANCLLADRLWAHSFAGWALRAASCKPCEAGGDVNRRHAGVPRASMASSKPCKRWRFACLRCYFT